MAGDRNGRQNRLDPAGNGSDKAAVIRTAGAYVAWVMGSGFATGQEILQFFTSFGYRSFILLAVNLAGFLLIGPMILEAGHAHRQDSRYDHFRYFCGRKLGTFYTWFLPLSMFAGMVILISGAGATLQEYYGLNHYIGALLMAGLALAAYIAGFQRFIRVVSLIGPVMIAFSVLVGIVTVVRGSEGLLDVNAYTQVMETKQPVPWWWLSGFLYISYNLSGGSKYYSALGASVSSGREARLGAVIGTLALMASILLMNSAMLTCIGETAVRDVPTLYLARQIAWPLGAVFSVILIMGIFSSCSAMLWTISEKFVDQSSKAGRIFAAGVCAAAFLLGLLPFAGLVGTVYTILGYVGMIFAGCVIWRRVRGTPAFAEKK